MSGVRPRTCPSQRKRANARRALSELAAAPYPGLRATRAPSAVRERRLPRHAARNCTPDDLLRRRRLPAPAPAARPHSEALRLDHLRLLPDGKPLPPRRADARAEHRPRDAVHDWSLLPALQRAARASRTRRPGPIRDDGDRGRGAVRQHDQVRRGEPGARRARAIVGGVAVDADLRPARPWPGSDPRHVPTGRGSPPRGGGRPRRGGRRPPSSARCRRRAAARSGRRDACARGRPRRRR